MHKTLQKAKFLHSVLRTRSILMNFQVFNKNFEPYCHYFLFITPKVNSVTVMQGLLLFDEIWYRTTEYPRWPGRKFLYNYNRTTRQINLVQLTVRCIVYHASSSMFKIRSFQGKPVQEDSKVCCFNGSTHFRPSSQHKVLFMATFRNLRGYLFRPATLYTTLLFKKRSQSFIALILRFW